MKLLLSEGAPWPGAADWRPAGWRTCLSPFELFEVLAMSRGPVDLQTILGGRATAEAARADAALLRDCWSTDEWVWRLAEDLTGPPGIDPFWNPWGRTHELWAGVRLLDGREGRDGFDPLLWGDGTAYVNGPHSDNARTIAAATAHARRGQAVALVAPLDGCEWALGAGTPDGKARADLLSADLLIHLGRVAFRPPPGVPSSSPRSAYVLALWGLEPEVTRELAGRRMWNEAAGRELVATAGCGDVRSAPPARRRRAKRQAASTEVAGPSRPVDTGSADL